MKAPTRRKPRDPRGQTAKAPSRSGLAEVVRQTTRLWRRHRLDYDQTKYVVEQVRRRLGLAAPAPRPHTIERLDRAEVDRLIAIAYRDGSPLGLMIKTLFFTGLGSASLSTSAWRICTWTTTRPGSI
jgi:integrase/recombinase XerD